MSDFPTFWPFFHTVHDQSKMRKSKRVTRPDKWLKIYKFFKSIAIQIHSIPFKILTLLGFFDLFQKCKNKLNVFVVLSGRVWIVLKILPPPTPLTLPSLFFEPINEGSEILSEKYIFSQSLFRQKNDLLIMSQSVKYQISLLKKIFWLPKKVEKILRKNRQGRKCQKTQVKNWSFLDGQYFEAHFSFQILFSIFWRKCLI